jgi:hypothetical protein
MRWHFHDHATILPLFIKNQASCQGNRILFLNTRIYGQLQAKSMNLSKYGFPYLGDGSEKWRSYPHIVPKNLDAIALGFLQKPIWCHMSPPQSGEAAIIEMR